MAGALTTKNGAALLGDGHNGHSSHKGNLNFSDNPNGGQLSQPTVKNK